MSLRGHHTLTLAHCLRTFAQENYSLSGEFHVLSKLIVCAVMLRGRHRGLPVAIDRAVILPFEFRQNPNGEDDDEDDSPQDSALSDGDGLNGQSQQNGDAYSGLSEKEKSSIPPSSLNVNPHVLQRRSWISESADSRRRTSSRVEEVDDPEGRL